MVDKEKWINIKDKLPSHAQRVSVLCLTNKDILDIDESEYTEILKNLVKENKLIYEAVFLDASKFNKASWKSGLSSIDYIDAKKNPYLFIKEPYNFNKSNIIDDVTHWSTYKE